MPNATSGFTGNEIVTRIQNNVGNYSDSFKTFVEQSLPMAEMRFANAHDWLYLRKAGLSLTVTNGTSEYDLTAATIGYNMHTPDVETIYDEDNGIVLKRVDLNQIRRFDPQNDDGTSDDTPTMWAPVDDNTIRIWPPTFASGTLKIDGKISGSNLWNSGGLLLTNYPYIPPHFQEAFIEYVEWMALDRENDDRAPVKRQEAERLIMECIKDDMRHLSNTDNARIRSMREAKLDGIGANIEALFIGWYDANYDYYW